MSINTPDHLWAAGKIGFVPNAPTPAEGARVIYQQGIAGVSRTSIGFYYVQLLDGVDEAHCSINVTLQRGFTGFATVYHQSNTLKLVVIYDAFGVLSDAAFDIAVFRLPDGATAEPFGGTGDPPTSLVNYYVDNVNGNDANDGLSPATAFASFEAAMNRIPAIVNRTYIINMAASATAYDFQNIAPRLYNQNVWVVGEVDQVGAARTAAAGSGTEAVVDSVGGLTVDVYRGKIIEMTSGLAAGQMRSVRSNSASTIYPVLAFGAAVADTDTYRIIEPGVDLLVTSVTNQITGSAYAPSPSTLTAFVPTKSIQFVNVRFEAAATVLMGVSGTAGFYGVEFDTNVFLFAQGQLLSGMDSTTTGGAALAYQPFEDGLVATSSVWAGMGIRGSNAGAFTGAFLGFYVGTRMQVSGPSAQAWFGGGSLIGDGTTVSPLRVTGGAYVNVGFGPSIASVVPMVLAAQTANTPAAVQAESDSLVELAQAVVSGVATSVATLLSETGALMRVLSNSAVAGSGAPYGIFARLGGAVQTTGASNGVTGTTDTLAAGQDPGTDHAASLGAVGNVVVPTTTLDGSIIQRVA